MLEWVKESYYTLKHMNVRHFILQSMQLGLIVTSALMIWKTLMLVTGSESPVVVVLSGSMEPGFYRGDILFLTMDDRPVRTGDIVVFSLDGRDIPIVHRAIKVHEHSVLVERTPQEGTLDILTKGDNNYGDDRALYNKGQEWIHMNNIMGRAVGYLPKVGMITIIMNDYPYLKFALIGLLGVLVLTNKEV
uniref:Signal peptidase complex catalytic subunit SEC11 n=1 Tax=Polytomella parva TaxID=51329 RepID=A0A7S0YCP7_9CHLO|mmetsp:Transcript_17971/g.32817  ORF Transcript_17971/g.32817 Transcript_17971/m.32817 type:complete len:190 (+) Transcript_17971:142-711(+)